MVLRRDALAAAAECVLAVEARCGREPELVGTVGRLETLPGAVNVIPGRVRFTLDLRAPVDAQREVAVRDVLAQMQAICARRRCTLRADKMHDEPVAACAPWLMEQVDRAVQAEGVKLRRLPSGAGHDGMAMQAVADIAMLFVRCRHGISHNPAEAISADDAGLAARVFLRFIENFRPAAT